MIAPHVYLNDEFYYYAQYHPEALDELIQEYQARLEMQGRETAEMPALLPLDSPGEEIAEGEGLDIALDSQDVLEAPEGPAMAGFGGNWLILAGIGLMLLFFRR